MLGVRVAQLNRRRFLCGLGAATVVGSPGTVAAQSRTPRIGVLRPTSASNPYTESFRQGLRELGYVEGQNIHIDYRYSEGHQDRLPALAAELVALKPDVILTDGPGIPAASRATGTIPLVYGVTGDPVADGVVASLARPGGNITGLSLMAPQVNTKRLELIKELLPQATRFAVLRNQARIAHRAELEELASAAARLNVALTPTSVSTSADFPVALAVA